MSRTSKKWISQRISILFVIALSAAAYAGDTGALRAGAARIDITPAANALPIPFTSIRDHLYARAIVLDNGVTRAAIIGIDLIEIDEDLWADTSKQIAQELKCPVENIVMSATHDHSSPYPDWGGPKAPPDPNLPAFRTKLKQGVIEAVRQAKASLQPARMGFSTGTTTLNVNRDAINPETRLWHQGPNLDGVSDKTVAVLKFETLSGDPIAIHVNYAMHAIDYYLMGILSGDFPGATSRYIEQTYDDKMIAIWSTGAAGDQNPLYLRVYSAARKAKDAADKDATAAPALAKAVSNLNNWVDSMGRVMGEEVLRVMDTTKRTSSEVRIWGGSKSFTCPGRDRSDNLREGGPGTYVDGDPVNVRLGLLTIGNTALASVDAEIYNPIALRLKKESPIANTEMVTVANGRANSGYIPTDEAFGRYTFQVLSTRLKPGCAETAIVNGEMDLLSQSLK
jgi:neutral ceramidase